MSLASTKNLKSTNFSNIIHLSGMKKKSQKYLKPLMLETFWKRESLNMKLMIELLGCIRKMDTTR